MTQPTPRTGRLQCS
ncbi:BgTH12-06539 [Blumeria graminis f. sp. triticale]|uniref:BgTH12-06539 n=1 Tax=Blumeria graminis f. sp. triticale TaxID=1689686 RepID=A0A9W4DFH8_BLUGR|nr:BgTH12-06539 [Blumeria graminis f. sp. triticale]